MGALNNNVSYQKHFWIISRKHISIGVLTGPFKGSNVVARALSKLGKASVVNQFQITTLNGQPTQSETTRRFHTSLEFKLLFQAHKTQFNPLQLALSTRYQYECDT